jgi:hypothetical protein
VRWSETCVHWPCSPVERLPGPGSTGTCGPVWPSAPCVARSHRARTEAEGPCAYATVQDSAARVGRQGLSVCFCSFYIRGVLVDENLSLFSLLALLLSEPPRILRCRHEFKLHLVSD